LKSKLTVPMWMPPQIYHLADILSYTTVKESLIDSPGASC
jgi:hypothetical protein